MRGHLLSVTVSSVVCVCVSQIFFLKSAFKDCWFEEIGTCYVYDEGEAETSKQVAV